MRSVPYTKENIKEHIDHDNYDWDLVESEFTCWNCHIEIIKEKEPDK